MDAVSLGQSAVTESLTRFFVRLWAGGIYHHQAQSLGFPDFRFSTGQVFNVAEVKSGRTETPWTIEL